MDSIKEQCNLKFKISIKNPFVYFTYFKINQNNKNLYLKILIY